MISKKSQCDSVRWLLVALHVSSIKEIERLIDSHWKFAYLANRNDICTSAYWLILSMESGKSSQDKYLLKRTSEGIEN